MESSFGEGQQCNPVCTRDSGHVDEELVETGAKSAETVPSKRKAEAATETGSVAKLAKMEMKAEEAAFHFNFDYDEDELYEYCFKEDDNLLDYHFHDYNEEELLEYCFANSKDGDSNFWSIFQEDVDNDPNWVEPDYSDKVWFQNSCLDCQICSSSFDQCEGAFKCFHEHKGYLRCFICFAAIEGNVKQLYQHYRKRHPGGDKPNTLQCPYCSEILHYSFVLHHVVAEHFVVSPPKPAVSPEAAQFLLDMDPGNFSADFLSSGQLRAEILDEQSQDFDNISTYIKNGQVHSEFRVTLLETVRLSREADRDRAPELFGSDNRTMLWHGTRAKFIGKILQDGFAIPIPNKQMFGQGIYFSDRVSKSARYCAGYAVDPQWNSEGYILLCEVQLGRPFHAKRANHGYTQPPSLKIYTGEGY